MREGGKRKVRQDGEIGGSEAEVAGGMAFAKQEERTVQSL